jgi:hypothetical protein
MIRYQLVCKKDHAFEGWFRDSTAYDTQAKKGELAEAAVKAKAMREWVSNVRKHVEKNAEYVGEKFPDEARAIHYGDAEERQIYGEATVEDAKELIEEGIPVAPLPSLPRADS